ncbi:hypothetical protein [Deinococcus sp.]
MGAAFVLAAVLLGASAFPGRGGLTRGAPIPLPDAPFVLIAEPT